MWSRPRRRSTLCRDAYDTIFNSVMQKYHLDGLLFPQETQEIGDIYTGGVHSTTVSEINIAQLPAVVVPDGSYYDGRPFSLEFVGPKFSEPTAAGLGLLLNPDHGLPRTPHQPQSGHHARPDTTTPGVVTI